MVYQLEIDSYIGYPISKAYVREKLRDAGGKNVNVKINSLGGDVSHALDIRQQFLDHGNVTAYIYGMTASAATIVAMGAKEIKMSKHSLMLLHQSSLPVDKYGMMNASQLAQAIEELKNCMNNAEKVDSVLAGIYAERSGLGVGKIAEVMKEARWLTADACLELGLIDGIIEDEPQQTPLPLDAKTSEHFFACGLPMPTEEQINYLRPVESSAQTESEMPTKNIVRALLNFAETLFSAKGKTNNVVAHVDDTPLSSTPHIEIPDSISKILGTDSLPASKTGDFLLNSDQMGAISETLNDLTTKLETARVKIGELKIEDGASTTPAEAIVTTTVETLPGASAIEFYNKFKDIL